MRKKEIKLKTIKLGEKPDSARLLTKSSSDGKKESMTISQTAATNPGQSTLQKSSEDTLKHSAQTLASETVKETDRKRKSTSEGISAKKKAEDYHRKAETSVSSKGGHNKKAAKKKKRMISDIVPNGYTQDLLDIKDIKNGLIQTKSNKYVQILEIFPINFYQKSIQEKNDIVSAFGTLFKEGPRTGQFKSITVKTDYRSYIRHLKEACPLSRGPELIRMRDDLIATIEQIGRKQTISYRYFYIYTYEGEADGTRSSKFEDINCTMREMRDHIRNVFESCGNIVANPENPTVATAEILHLLLNRGQGEEEGFLKRKLKIDNDYLEYNRFTNSHERVDVASYFAPKGIYFVNSRWMMSGGTYYTYIAIKDNGYPDRLPPDWINIIRNQPNVDIDFYYAKLHHDNTYFYLDKRNFYTTINYKQGTAKKREALAPKIKNTSLITESMKQGEDLFDCLTVLTLRGDDPKELMNERSSLCKTLKTQGLKVEECYRDLEMFYKMTLPLCSFDNQIFRINKRNFLTSSMESVYHFTGYESADYTGSVIGRNLENASLFSINNTNTLYYKNGNIVILGSSGAGKSFFEMAFGRRQVIAGHRVFYILPVKGYEYRDACRDVGGTYIRLVPGSDDCLNIMDLFSKEAFHPSLGDTEEKDYEDSVLSEKISSLCAWFKMLSIREDNPNFIMSTMDINRMNALLMELYHDFGITKDNDSIWIDKKNGLKKPFPAISDWKDRIEQSIHLEKYAALLLPFTEGNFQNFNGQTNVDLSKDSIVFDCDEKLIGEDLLPIIQYIAFECAQNLVKSDPDNYGFIITDEIWRMLLDEVTAKIINNNCRLIRGYGGCIVMASQDIEEFTQNRYGPGLINNTNIKVVMYLEDNAFDALQPVLKLSDTERKYFRSFTQGQGMFITSRERTRFELITSINEQISYNTDVTKKERLLAIKRQMGEDKRRG